MKSKYGSLAFLCVMVMLVSFIETKKMNLERESEMYMTTANESKIKAGCFYVVKDKQGVDSIIVTKKNY